MTSKSKKIMINIDYNKSLNWKLLLENELIKVNTTNIEINSNKLDISCSEILEIIAITKKYNCKIVGFFSTSSKTIVSASSLGYHSHFIVENSSNTGLKVNNNNNNNFSKTSFHQGTVRSGEYLESSSDLLILGDVNPGAKVSAEGNIIIWGRLLGIAHAGCKGNTRATISALQLRPVQLRIASKVARGPAEKPQPGIAEEARIDLEEIIISPLEST